MSWFFGYTQRRGKARKAGMTRYAVWIVFVFSLISGRMQFTGGFILLGPSYYYLSSSKRTFQTAARQQQKNGNDDEGYKLGDISRSLWNEVRSENKERGYRFGDISRWIDRKAKDRVSQLTGKTEYKFGDLTLWLDGQIKSEINNFTNETEYKVGDLTKEVIRRVQTGEYDASDVWLAFRMLISVGVPITPIANAMPIKMLLNLVNFGLGQDLSGRAMETVAKSLDDRITAAVTGDSKYKISDMAGREIEKKVMGLLGKDTYGDYKFGDLSRRILSLSKETNKDKLMDLLTLSNQAENDLAAWDKRLVQEQQQNSSSR